MESSRLLDPVDAFYKTSASGRRRRDGRSSSKRSKSHYKKLLWFKQPCQCIIISICVQHLTDCASP